jgi:hypothetical protein
MSKLFFDNLVAFEEIEVFIKESASSEEEREELWGLVDQVINHKVVEKILDRLPRDNHEEFLEIFHKCPHDEVYIFAYLKEKAGGSIEDEIKDELRKISDDILGEIKGLLTAKK